MSRQPYIIVAPKYAHNCAGNRALHRLGHLLNETGEKAYIYDNGTNPNWNVSSISPARGDLLIEDGAIVVYPEVVSGNPMQGKTVVRYLLNNPGQLGGGKSFDPLELLFCHTNHLLQPGMSSDRVLCIPVIDTKIFYNDNRQRDIECLVYFGKQKRVGNYPEDLIIGRDKPSKQKELGKMLRRCKKLISYDNLTALIFEATLCGCPVVIIPDGFRKKIDLENSEFGLKGVAWGKSPEEFAKAQATLSQAPEMLKKVEENLAKSLKNFISITQKQAKESLKRILQGVSIIILNFNGKEQLRENLPSIIKNLDSTVPTEIIVVDNGSTDKSVEFLKASFPQVKIVCLDKNHGFCKGLNEGAKTAKHDLLLFLNNDIQATQNFLPPLIKHFEDPKVFGVSPKAIRPSQNNINESIILGGFEGGVINARFSQTQKLDLPPLSLEIFSVCGAAFMVDKKMFQKIGGLDGMFAPFYYEETDLSYRALKRGWKIIYDPNSTVLHMHDQTIGKQFKKPLALWSYRKNQYLCTWKNITSPCLLFRHFMQMIIPKLLIPNPIEWKALFSALKQLPEALKQKQSSYLSDREVLKKASQQAKSIEIKSKTKKILVIRPDAIGDLVLTLPAIHALKENFPNAKIAALVAKYTAPILENNPDIDEIIHDYDLKKHKFDLSVNFFNEGKDTLATFKARIPYRLGDSSRILTGWMNNLRVFRNWDDITKHDVEQNLALLEPLGIKASQTKPQITIDQSALEKTNQLLKDSGIAEGDLLVGVHIGSGSTHNKSWNTSGYAQVIDWLVENKQAKVVLLGGKDAYERAEKICVLCKNRPLNLVGRISLSELIALTNKLKFYLGPDTGPTHIAAALNIPLVVIYISKRAKPLRWGPWQTRHLVVKNFSQCEKVCVPSDCKDNIICTQELEPEEVIAACEEVLSGGGVKTQEETLDHWKKKSFSIALINNSKKAHDIERVKELLSQFRNKVFNAHLISSRNPKTLLRFFIKHDINIIHLMGKKGRIAVFIAWLLTGIFQSNRALLVKNTSKYLCYNTEYETQHSHRHL